MAKIMKGADLLRRLHVPEELITSDGIDPFQYMMMGFSPMGYDCTDCDKHITAATMMMTEDMEVEIDGKPDKAGKLYCMECGQKRIDSGEFELVAMLDDIKFGDDHDEEGCDGNCAECEG